MDHLARDGAVLVARLRSATVPRTEAGHLLPARFALELGPDQDPDGVAATVDQDLADLRTTVAPLSALDPEMLVLDLLDRALDVERPAACFAAGYALAERFELVGAEPDLPTAFFPEHDTVQDGALTGGALAAFRRAASSTRNPRSNPRPRGRSTGCTCHPAGPTPSRAIGPARART